MSDSEGSSEPGSPRYEFPPYLVENYVTGGKTGKYNLLHV